MTNKDSLLALTSYPDATPDYIFEQAVDFSRLMGARLSALVFVLNRGRVARMHSMGEWLIDVPGLIDEAVQRSATEATRLLAHFENVAKRRDVFEKSLSEQTSIFPSPDTIVEHARMHDMTFLPIPKQFVLDELNSETVIFGSGRPTILLPAITDYKPKPASLDIIAVAWDFSRSAARALAYAMPILEKAKRVHIFTVVDEKPMPEKLSSERLERHLLLHGVDATLERVEAAGRDIGKVIEGFVSANHADLLVMGAFGHSRMMEFILGGATRSILNHPPVPVLISH